MQQRVSKGKKIYCPSVEDFLTLIRYADYIITDSFHGTAFSLNFNKQFYASYPVMRFMFDNNDIGYKFKVISSGWKIFGLSSIIYIIIGIILFLFTDIKYLFLILVSGIFLNIQTMYSYSVRGFEKNFQFAVSGLINTFITAIMNVFLIVVIKMDFSAMYISSIIGNIAQIVYIEYNIKLIKNIKLYKNNKSLFKEMFKYTLPLCFNSVSYWLLTGYNRVLISNLLTIEENGIYAVANKFAAVIVLITTCFTLAWQEMSFKRSKDDQMNGIFYSKACDMYTKFLGIGIILLIPVFNIIFPLFVSKSYLEAKNIIPLFLIMTITSTYSTFVGNIFYALKKTNIIFISTALSCVFNMIVSTFLIKKLGLNGANLSIALSFILNIAIRHIILKRLIEFKFKITHLFIFSIGIALSSFIYIKGNVICNIIWVILLVIVLILIFKKFILKTIKDIIGHE